MIGKRVFAVAALCAGAVGVLGAGVSTADTAVISEPAPVTYEPASAAGCAASVLTGLGGAATAYTNNGVPAGLLATGAGTRYVPSVDLPTWNY